MKRKMIVLCLAVILLLSFIIMVKAATNAAVITPSLTYNGTTANCRVTIRDFGKTIATTMELKQGSTVIASWSDSSTSVLNLSETVTVTSGQTYTLRVSGTINGTAFTTVQISKTCP